MAPSSSALSSSAPFSSHELHLPHLAPFRSFHAHDLSHPGKSEGAACVRKAQPLSVRRRCNRQHTARQVGSIHEEAASSLRHQAGAINGVLVVESRSMRRGWGRGDHLTLRRHGRSQLPIAPSWDLCLLQCTQWRDNVNSALSCAVSHKGGM